MRALGFQFRAGDAGVHFVATPLGTQLSIAKLYTWLARKSPKWRFLAGKIIERHEGVFFRKPCVCVWNVCTDVKLRSWLIVLYVMLYYIIFYLEAGGHRGPGGSVANEDTPRDTCKRTCLQWPDSPWAPSCAAGMSLWTHRGQSMGASVHSLDVQPHGLIIIYIHVTNI